MTSTPLCPTAPATPAAPPRETVTGDLGAQARTSIVITGFATPDAVATPAGNTSALGIQIADVISADLERSGLYAPLGPGGLRLVPMTEVTAPRFDNWRPAGAESLIEGFVRADAAGNLTVGCYLYDMALGSELARNGFVVQPRDWRRAAHRCADAIYSRLSGEAPFFDSRIAYIAESGPKGNRVKRLAIMDSDGANHRFITNGQSMALTPRFSPDYKSIVYVSYLGSRVRIYIYDIGAGQQKLVSESNNPAFAPRWSPDGRFLLFSMSVAGNTDIYREDVRIRLNGAGEVAATIPAGANVSVVSAGAGTVQLTGRADGLTANVSGPGAIDASALTARDLTLRASGTGSSRFTASRSATLTVTGAANASVVGRARCTISNMGAGSVTCENTARGALPGN